MVLQTNLQIRLFPAEHFALGHLLQTFHCRHVRAMLTALQLAETFCTEAEYSTLHVRRTGCVWTCPRIPAPFFNSSTNILQSPLIVEICWNHHWILGHDISLSKSCGICVILEFAFPWWIAGIAGKSSQLRKLILLDWAWPEILSHSSNIHSLWWSMMYVYV